MTTLLQYLYSLLLLFKLLIISLLNYFNNNCKRFKKTALFAYQHFHFNYLFKSNIKIKALKQYKVAYIIITKMWI